jgi:hypothetical protein
VDLDLCNHITNNNIDVKFVLMLNKIEERLITPCLAFMQIFQLKGYEQFGMHGNIVNFSTNLDLVQNVLSWMPYDDSSLVVCLKRNL